MTEPVLWVIRYSLDHLDPNSADGPELSVMRVVDPEHADPDEQHEVIVAPATATGVLIADPAGRTLAFLTVAQLLQHVDADRPVLLLQAATTNVGVAPSWPMHFASLDDTDPLLGVSAHVHTDTPGVKLGWIEGHLLGDQQLTVADLFGGQ